MLYEVITFIGDGPSVTDGDGKLFAQPRDTPEKQNKKHSHQKDTLKPAYQARGDVAYPAAV